MRLAVIWALKFNVVLGLQLFLGLHAASAYNVPGTQNLLIRPTTRAAVSMHVNLVRSCLQAADLSDNRPKGNLVGQETILHGGSGSTEYRYDLGTALMCATSEGFQTPLGDTYLGATVGGEFGNGTMQFNRGSLEHLGVTVSAFGFVTPQPNLRVFGELGVTYLDFMSTRSSGIVRGDFNALRFFANGGLIYELQWASWVVRSTGMFTYATERTSAYSETGSGAGLLGPGLVPQTTINIFIGTLEGRLGYRMDNVMPYVVASISQDFTSTQGLVLTSGPIPSLFPTTTMESVGLGIEALAWPGTSFNFEAGYLAGTENLHGWTFDGRLTFEL